MAYIINKTNGDTLVTVEDGTVDNSSTSLSLIGKNYPGYGELVNENFVKLLENFASSTQPTTPVRGQLWYDTTTNTLKIYGGTSFKSASSGVANSTELVAGLKYVTYTGGVGDGSPIESSSAFGPTLNTSTANFGVGIQGQAGARLTVSAGSTYNRSLSSPIGSDTIAHFHGVNTQAARVVVDGYASADGSSLSLRQNNSNAGTNGASPSDAVLGSINGDGNTGSGYTLGSASIKFRAGQTFTTANQGTVIEFWTTPNNTANANVSMRLTGSGALNVRGDITAFALSDQRLKQDVEPITQALDKIRQLQGITFKWNMLAEDKNHDRRDVGLLAQQVQAVLPEVVTQRDSGYLAIQYEKLVPLLVEAIKELSDQLDQLRQA